MNEVIEKFTSLVSSDFACDSQEHDEVWRIQCLQLLNPFAAMSA
jgi:hypothetical protein